MFLFIRLVLAHMIADFPLQTAYIYKLKGRGIIGIIPHVLIVFACMTLLAWPYLHLPLMWVFLAFLALSHLIQDRLKILLNAHSKSHFIAYFLDQAMHITFITCIFLSDIGSITPPAPTGPLTEFYNNNNLMLLLTFLIAASFNGHYMIITLKKDIWGIATPYTNFEKWYGIAERCILCCSPLLGPVAMPLTIFTIFLARSRVIVLKKTSARINADFSSLRETLLSCLFGLGFGAALYFLIHL